MKVSSRARYGLIAMLHMALNSNGDKITINTIANSHNIPLKYLEHIFSSLKKSGILISSKGSQGGYTLALSAGEIKISDILRSLEGELSILSDTQNNISDKSNYYEMCIKNNVFDKIDLAVSSVVENITLKELVEYYLKSIDTNQNYMYYI